MFLLYKMIVRAMVFISFAKVMLIFVLAKYF